MSHGAPRPRAGVRAGRGDHRLPGRRVRAARLGVPGRVKRGADGGACRRQRGVGSGAARITDPGSRVEVLGRLAMAVAASSDPDRAVALIAQIGNPGARAMALSKVAMAISGATEKTSPVCVYPPGRAPMLVRARHLLGEALATGSWTEVASSLALLDPPAVSALADELQLRWKLNGPASPEADKNT